MDTKTNPEIVRPVTFKKNCRCHGEAATNRFVITDEVRDNAFYKVVTFLPMPSCCECNEPWIPASPENTA